MSPAPALPESLDLTHHLNKRVRFQTPSVMKALGRMVKERKLLSLAGGLPHHTLFPVQHVSFTLPKLSSLNGDVGPWVRGEAETEIAHLKKTGPGTEDDEGGILDLNDVLQYGISNGYPELIDLLLKTTQLIHGHPYADLSVYVTLGNTDGVSKTWSLFIDPDNDTVLTEEFAFASSLNSGRSKGAKFYPIKTDGQGMDPADLEAVLKGWDELTLGRKPHLMYTVPCGQNPTGTIMPQTRYDAIYAICQKYDIIIIEDDPYYPLQYLPYEKDTEKRAKQLADARASMPPVPATASEDDPEAVARVFNDFAGVRSYLSRDVDGRVVRIDTFSKVFGPGMRLGWVSANSTFVERLMRIGETTTQVPNNVAQATLANYLSDKHWGIGGWIRWQWGVRLEYQIKRDYFLDCLAKYCPSELVSTVPCGAGMFQWLQVSISKHPRYLCTPLGSSAAVDLTANGTTTTSEPGVISKASETVEYTTNTGELMDELWEYLMQDGGVLLMPAKIFQVTKPGVDQTDRLNFFRATFAGDLENIDKALQVFGKGVQEWFNKG